MNKRSWFLKSALVATVMVAAATVSAAPASAASTAHCSSLGLDRVSLFPNQDYIVGSCTPANPRAGAQMKFTVTCHVTGDRDVYVTLNYGQSFRADTGCGGWGAQSLTYNPTYVG